MMGAVTIKYTYTIPIVLVEFDNRNEYTSVCIVPQKAHKWLDVAHEPYFLNSPQSSFAPIFS